MSKSPSLRRIQADIRELAQEPSDRYSAAPLEDDMFEWHFTIKGPKNTEFEGGLYHGRILLPPEYPFKPPHIVFLTPSGRFETNTKVCLSFTAYHQELWQPAWGIRLILEAIISFLPTPADGAIGALDWDKEERRRLAKKSRGFVCDKCGPICDLVPDLEEGVEETGKFGKEIEMLKLLQVKNENKKEAANSTPTTTNSTHAAVTTAVQSNTVTPVTTIVQSNTGTQSSSWLSDPLIHGSILTFAMIIFLFYRKIETLLNELDKLDD